MPAGVAYIYIYSNDGTQVLHEYMTGADLLTVTDKGCIDNASSEWTYTGTNTFLGFATSPNATEPTYAIGSSITLLLNGGSQTFYIVEREAKSSGVTVEYNGSVVATIENGNKATLPIKDLKMKSDLVVTVPEATDSPLPIEVSTEAEMAALLTSGEVGGVYKYVGETTDAYENGALYVLEESILGFVIKETNTNLATVEEVAYQFEEGMTWGEWIDSEYNIDGGYKVTLSNNKIYCVKTSGSTYVSYNSTDVLSTDTIIKDAIYTVSIWDSEGGSND